MSEPAAESRNGADGANKSDSPSMSKPAFAERGGTDAKVSATVASQPSPNAAASSTSAGNNSNAGSSNTPPVMSSPKVAGQSPNANSPKSAKPKRSNAASSRGGGGGPKSPSMRAMDNDGAQAGEATPPSVTSGITGSQNDSGNNKTSGNSDTKEQSKSVAAGAVGLGVESGSGTKSDSPSPQSSTPSRRGGAGKFNGERPANSSRGGFGGGRGGDDDSVRGRRSDRRTTRAEAGNSSPNVQNRTTWNTAGEASVPSPTQGMTGSLTKAEPSGVIETKRTQKAIRSPRSPRSPRRGFGERGTESRMSNPSQDTSSSPRSENGSTRTENGVVSKEQTGPVSPSSPATPPAGPLKKRQANKRNKRRDNDEVSLASTNSTRDAESTTESVERSKTAPRKQDGPDSAASVGGDSAQKRENVSNGKEGSSPSTWVPKSKTSRGPQQQRQQESNEDSSITGGPSSGSRDVLSSNSSRNKRDDAPYHSKGNQQNQRNGQRPQQTTHDRRDADPADANAGAPTRQKDAQSKNSAAALSDSVPESKDKDHASTVESAATAGWDDSPATAGENNWGESSAAGLKWGATAQSQETLAWGEDFQVTNESREATGDSWSSGHSKFAGSGRGIGRGIGRGRPMGAGDSRFGGSQQGYPRGGQRHQPPDSDSPGDARSSLDARNARLGFQRGPRPGTSGSHSDSAFDKGTVESTKDMPARKNDSTDDSSSIQREAPLESRYSANSPSTRSSIGSSDVRLDSRYSGRQNAPRPGPRGEAFSRQYGQSNQSSTSVSSDSRQRAPTTAREKFDQPGQPRRGPKLREPRGPKGPASRPIQVPLFSNSLECQMTWNEMDLRSNVLAGIAKAGLEKPSNIQKLIMQPFKEGKDVIAQSQSQNDRTNTLAIALLQKLSPTAATHKHCQALVICSEGINPQKVHEDCQGWFEAAPGMKSVLLTTDIKAEQTVLSDPEQAKQVVVTTLGPLMEALRNDLLDMKAIETVVISMRAEELVGFESFKQVWALLSPESQVILMTGKIASEIQMIKSTHLRADTAVRRADELTMQWSEHYFVSVPPPDQQAPPQQETDGGDGDNGSKDQGEPTSKDHKWEVLLEILTKNPDISHTVIITQSQSLTQALTTKLEAQKLPVLSVWSMADKTEVARQFNAPEPCILVLQSVLMDNLDLDYSSLVINYEMPKRADRYISLFGPFGRSGLRTLMINFCVTEDMAQKQTLADMESMYDIKIREMQLD